MNYFYNTIILLVIVVFISNLYLSIKKNHSIETDKKSKRDLATDKFDFDENVDFYYNNLINSLVLFTYDSEKLKELEPILIDPLTELYEEIDYAFIPDLLESVFRNKMIDLKHKSLLLEFKQNVDQIPNEIWNYNSIDDNIIWKKLRFKANEILEKIGVNTRIYDQKYNSIINVN